MILSHRLASRTLGSLLTVIVRRFVIRALGAHVCALVTALLWTACLSGTPVVVVLLGQLLIVACANLLVARLAPLSVSLRALLRR